MSISINKIAAREDRVYVQDFFELAGVNMEFPKASEMTGWQKDGITNKQKDYLHVLGLGNTGVEYKYHAMKAIDLAVSRAKKGLATPQEMRDMKCLGIKNVHIRTHKEAQYILRNYWRKDFDPDEYNGLRITCKYNLYGMEGVMAPVQKSRKDARKVYKTLKAKGATNFTFIVKEV